MTPPRRIPLKVYGLSGWDSDAFLLPGVDVDFGDIEYRKLGLAVLESARAERPARDSRSAASSATSSSAATASRSTCRAASWR